MEEKKRLSTNEGGNTDTSMQAYIHVATRADKAIFIMHVNRPGLQTLEGERSRYVFSDLLLELLK